MTVACDPGGRRPRGLPDLPSRLAGRGRLRTRTSLILLWILPLVLTTASGCAAPVSAAFASPFDTREAVTTAVLDALWQRDVNHLQSLAISQAEFKTTIWPALPQVRAGHGGSADYWWADLSTRSHGSMADVVGRFGGRRMRLETMAFGGAPIDYATFRVHRNARLVVREADGTRQEIRVFGALIESGGGWKVYSYVVD